VLQLQKRQDELMCFQPVPFLRIIYVYFLHRDELDGREPAVEELGPVEAERDHR
jgi:hypothetical protein